MAKNLKGPGPDCPIDTAFYCGFCLNELPKGMPIADYTRVHVGICKDGSIMVWCNRHDEKVIRFHTKSQVCQDK